MNDIPTNDHISFVTKSALDLVKWIDIDFSLTRDKWAKNLEDIPGWYFIRTDAPIDVLKDLAHNEVKNNCRIAERTVENNNVIDWRLSCLPNDEGLTVVYNGEAKSTRSRLCSHIFGGKGTGCLALKHDDYKDIRAYQWEAGWVYFRDVVEGLEDDEGIRVAIEKASRALIGWPILCYERKRRRIVVTGDKITLKADN